MNARPRSDRELAELMAEAHRQRQEREDEEEREPAPPKEPQK